MSIPNQLQPQALWRWFEQICAIPHPSTHEQALSLYIQNWAKDNQLTVITDKVGNLIIKKPATAGMKNRKVVALQAHLDMVPQKNSDINHDFNHDPIETCVDTNWVTAKGTTLGADNGIGLASILAILGSKDIVHGPLEALLTVEEETSMAGAFGLKAGCLDAQILINTDSEQADEIYTGCAGGVNAHITLPLTWQATTPNHRCYTLSLTGLKGGHSGVDIHLGRGNANKLLARFLFKYQATLGLKLTDFSGGSLRNAIPREAHISFMLPNEQVTQLDTLVRQFTMTLKQEFVIADADIQLTFKEISAPAQVMNPDSQQTLIELLSACPNGVMRMNDEIKDITETSLNLGVVTTTTESASILCLIRSLVDSGREQVEDTLHALSNLAGGNIKFSGAYPGWQPDGQSEILSIVKQTYEKLYHQSPRIMVIHAGLECGLFKRSYPDMDMVSIGPTICFPHSPDEKVAIDSVAQYWGLLLAVLQRIPQAN